MLRWIWDPSEVAVVEGAIAIVEECDAFLEGSYVELCEARRTRVPVWAWMNLIAHDDECRLREVAAGHAPTDQWHNSRRFVIGELVDLVDRGTLVLAEFQAEALVPLELDVMACRDAEGWRPGQLMGGLLGTFPAHRALRRRSQ
jgi:hypothetical protein